MSATPELAESGASHSALYRGFVRHRRFRPVENQFRYPIYLLYLDLEEVPGVFEGRWLWSVERSNVASFRRRDFLGDPEVPLDEAVRDLVAQRTGRRPTGPIRLLTQLRTLGLLMNPASFYYCFDAEGELDAVVVEITNTPWGERYSYVLDGGTRHPGGEFLTLQRRKVFHVSPFMDLEQEYRWRYHVPGERLLLHVENQEVGEGADPRRLFDATVDLERHPLTGPNLARALGGQPFMTARVALWIYYQAAKLWLRKVPFVPHPRVRGLTPEGHPDLNRLAASSAPDSSPPSR